MTSLFYIVIAVVSTATLVGSGVAFIYKRKMRSKHGSETIEPFYQQLQENHTNLLAKIQENRQDIDRFHLKLTDLEEFCTRMVNRVSARSKRAQTKAEEMEQMQELLRQSQEIDQQKQGQTDTEFNGPGPNQRPRLVRLKNDKG